MPRFYDNNLIGYACTGIEYFSGTDTKEKFEKNLKHMPDDWCYRTKQIEYKRNLYGHRSPIEILNLNFDNYLLFVGDSYTEGIGLALEDTYPYLISKKLNMDYYNMGIGGAGNDLILYNLLMWLTSFPKPKFVFINFTWPYRSLLNFPHGSTLHLAGVNTKNSKVKNFFDAGEAVDYFNFKFELQVRMCEAMLKKLNVKHCYTSAPYLNMSHIKINRLPHTDLARDEGHIGIDSSLKFSQDLINIYLNS